MGGDLGGSLAVERASVRIQIVRREGERELLFKFLGSEYDAFALVGKSIRRAHTGKLGKNRALADPSEPFARIGSARGPPPALQCEHYREK